MPTKKVSYKDTVNTPRTDFPMRAGLPEREPEILAHWDEIGLYERIQERNRNGEWFLLHDGPPYANGHIHMGTTLNKVLKDFVVKYKSMCGYRSPYVPGFDCHGLPIEHALFKQLGKSKHDVDRVEFHRMAREFAQEWIGVQTEEFRRLGVLGTWDRPYMTMQPEVEAREIECFGRLYLEGYVYHGLKPTHWCTSCETALAEAEVEYGDKTSPSIYVKFRANAELAKLFGVAGQEACDVLIWTTTPWTLPANVGLAVGEGLDYVAVKAAGETLIVAESALPRLKTELGWQAPQIVGRVKGGRMDGLTARHPFYERDSRVILGSEYVMLDTGSGIIHTAPGHGHEDFIMGRRSKLEVLSPVDEQGRFVADLPLFGGQSVWAANKPIIEHLATNGRLLAASEYAHSYPHCWRCKRPVIFRATPQYFLNVEHNDLRKRALEAIEKTEWIPAYGIKRIGSMVEGRPDWCLSRQRLWGVPVPIFIDTRTGARVLTREILDHLVALVRERGIVVWTEREVKDLLPEGVVLPDGAEPEDLRKEEDILDVWFDSGLTHQTVMGQRPELKFPCELYLEGSDQHRGWFQTSLLTSVALTGRAPFDTVLTHGWTLDEAGEKESKSKGNITSPTEVMKTLGADIIRLWVASVDYTGDVMVGPHVIEQTADSYRKVRNTLRFLLGNLHDFDPARHAVPLGDLSEIDRWALAKLQQLLDEVTKAYERFEFYRVFRRIYTFCVVELSSFYLDVLKDRLYVSAAESPERRSAQTALQHVAETLILMLAPVLAFTAEEAWRALKPGADLASGGAGSVHLEPWPTGNPRWRERVLEAQWDRFDAIRPAIMKRLEELRARKVIGNSLEAEVELLTTNDELAVFLESFEDLAALCIVSKIKVTRITAGETAYATSGLGEPVGDELWVRVERTSGAKCDRCWKYYDALSGSAQHPRVCTRCLAVLEKLGL
ncbi:MAG: isoleucine--tRNA ligase [Verrucomicrobia bacterium]|nr:isoleucine--tRNA ligase [Verrucomicrobiota bacterium]